ncbi:putative sterol glucosyltransferase [Fusarium heterosporum]|uniref:Putative sterol glucosyltransferase n=1 Tax=Fusarium heterosporum TaxID=42747 RepID=A0A8H5WVA1_FUSHE|nr:putative sterol glucosyltransferase [Fusarium heterosporum]
MAGNGENATETINDLPQYEALAELEATTTARDDGRIDIDLNSRIVRRLSRLIPAEKSTSLGQLPNNPPEYSETSEQSIRLNVVIQVVGSRGDVQPFVALGTELRRHGHRVRLATHGQFDKFVRDSDLEFFSIGGDPAELMAYMVKNPGLFPSMKTLRGGEIQRKRKMVDEMLHNCWRSCIEPDELTGQPFVADAIIANPPSFAHIHCAQALGVPLHLMFTMPWTSTREFCHPLANLQANGSDMSASAANYVSYSLVEWMTWQGLGDVINTWRDTIDLEPIPFSEGPCLAETLGVPFTYCWSPALVPKPADWAENIDVCGFFFREMPSYQPDGSLHRFLSSGPPPVYIGFGSIVIDDPQKLTSIILEAVKAAGTRAIVSRGWSKLGEGVVGDHDVFFLGDCPHEWLFQHVTAVVHHGGAGTTACGLLNAKPTTIVPFFGDQPFWGNMVHAGGAGPAPIPFKSLDAHNLADAIKFCLTPEASTSALQISNKMSKEAGVRRAVASFHANLPLERMRCDILPNMAAVWSYQHKGKQTKLSRVAAEMLVEAGKVSWKDLKRYESKPVRIENRRWDPVTAALSSLTSTSVGLVKSASDIVIKPIQAFRPATPDTDRASSSRQAESKHDEDIYGRSAGLELPPTNQITKKEHHMQRNALTAVKGSAAGVGTFLGGYYKGLLLDLPYAVTEGMRNAPKLYGGQVYNPGEVTDWKSGGIAAGKNFAHGIVEGIGGIVMEPVRGAKKDGASGAAKGVGIGLLNLGAKVSSGAVGLVALPGQGMYQSARALMKRKTGKRIMEARKVEGKYVVKQTQSPEIREHWMSALRSFESGRAMEKHV